MELAETWTVCSAGNSAKAAQLVYTCFPSYHQAEPQKPRDPAEVHCQAVRPPSSTSYAQGRQKEKEKREERGERRGVEAKGGSAGGGASRCPQALTVVEEVVGSLQPELEEVEDDCGNPAQTDFICQRMAARSQWLESLF
ncbi:hypothetical protein Anapl_18997 [Anas platyrhynchos]|uniref:Uncharacterized protein n=1 Tax=Anas platyrhynchos TaxID=8839 RepID=R0LDT7_ANAPL|nr:hypothetical protein Anapl_18997 [Anas platyrhynchos]